MIPLALRACVRHLTSAPLPYDAREAVLPPARMLPWFPVVGLAIGGAVWLALLLPLPALPRAAIALAVWTIATGGLHEDGFLDAADAALAPVSAERRLQILKDPHVGAHAATAGTILMLLRFAALTAVLPVAAVIAAVVGRWCMAATLALLRPARASGLGASFAAHADWLPATAVALAILAAAMLLTNLLAVLGALLAGAAAGLAAASFLVRRFGGASGDVHGAAGLLAETAALYGFLIVQ